MGNALVAGAGGTSSSMATDAMRRSGSTPTPAGPRPASSSSTSTPTSDPGRRRTPSRSSPRSDGGFLLARERGHLRPGCRCCVVRHGPCAYPTVTGKSVAPLSGVGLAVPLYARDSELSYQAISCLTSPTALSTMMSDPATARAGWRRTSPAIKRPPIPWQPSPGRRAVRHHVPRRPTGRSPRRRSTTRGCRPASARRPRRTTALRTFAEGSMTRGRSPGTPRGAGAGSRPPFIVLVGRDGLADRARHLAVPSTPRR